jgi:hypothetical protein
MSYEDYETARIISSDSPSFRALIMAALGRADAVDLALLVEAWPEIVAEDVMRTNNRPRGFLESEVCAKCRTSTMKIPIHSA